jgi:VCBS repeat-containing protein
VVGTNDGPTMQTPAVSRALTEDSGVNGSGNLAATGLAQFADVDLTDTHTLSATLQSAVLSDGGSLPAGLQALLDTAVTTSFNDDSNGDGHGELQWNFGLSNSAVQFLAQGETLTLHYNVNVTDPFGAAATQDVGITITGVDDAPFVTASAPSNDLTEQGGSVAGTATSVVNLSIGDVDSIASYDTTGWTNIDATHWSKTGTYGSAVLDTSANTLTYTLDNGDPDTNALSTGQTVHDDFTVGVHEDNGVLTGTAPVSFAIHGTTDAGPVKVAVVYNSTTVGASVLAAQLNDDTYFDFQASVVRFDQVDSAAELSNYDVVVDAQSYFESGSEQYYAALKDWVAADGGGVVTTDWFSYKMNGNGLTSTQLANADFITPIAANHNGWGYSDATVFTVNASHPITQGVTSLATTVNQYQWTATPLIDADAVSLATYSGTSNGFNSPSWSGVAYKDVAGMGHEVYLGGFYSDASYRDADVQHGPADQLLEQAVHWAGSHDALML